MKGLTHFISGVAFGTFFSPAVAAASAGSFVLVLGGVGGILPDTFDFKLARFFEVFDVEIDPDHEKPDPKKIAEEVARAMEMAHKENRTVKILLHTVRLGADAWRKYSIFFNSAEQKIQISIGPVISTGQVPYVPSMPPEDERYGEAKVNVPFVHTYDRGNDVTIFSGPDFDFKPRDGKVEIEFLSWHRRWSHSITVASFGGFIVYLMALFASSVLKWSLPVAPWIYGVIMAGGGIVHVLEDQTGFMGSNLFYPFTKERSTGLQMFHSGHPVANFTTFWLAVSLIAFNLNRFSPEGPVWDVGAVTFLGWVFFAPMALVYMARLVWSRPKKSNEADFGDLQDIIDESKEDGGGL